LDAAPGSLILLGSTFVEVASPFLSWIDFVDSRPGLLISFLSILMECHGTFWTCMVDPTHSFFFCGKWSTSLELQVLFFFFFLSWNKAFVHLLDFNGCSPNICYVLCGTQYWRLDYMFSCFFILLWLLLDHLSRLKGQFHAYIFHCEVDVEG